MNKDLQDIDKLFLAVLEKNTEQPSASVKEKLVEALDKKKTESNRRRFIWWRGVALLLTFLLAGYVLFDTTIFKQGKKTGNKNSAVVSDNKTEKDKILLGEQTESGAIVNKGSGWSKINEPHSFFSNGKVSIHFNPNYTDAEKKQTIGVIDGYNLPESSSENVSTGIRREALLFVTLTDRTSKAIARRLQKPLPDAQPSLLKINKAGRFRPYLQLGFFFSYDQAGYRLDSDDPVVIRNIKHSEVHEPSYSTGVLLSGQFTRKWALQTGLVYSYSAIGINPKKIYAFQDPSGDIAYKYINSSGYAYIKPGSGPPPVFGDSITVESKHTLKTVHIPMMLRYTAGKNKLTISPAIGTEVAIVTSAESEIELTDMASHEKVYVNRLSGTKKFYISAVASVDVQYKLNSKTSVGLQPFYRQAFSPITENNVVETFPRSLGIRAVMAIKF